MSWAALAWNTKKWDRLLHQRLLAGQREQHRAA